MTNASRSINEELKARDRQIQELKEELEKYRRRDELRESLIRARCKYAQVICHKENIRDGARKTCQNLTELLSMDGLPDDLRADLESKKSAAEAKLHEVHAEIFEEECDYIELVKSLKDELDALK